MSTIDSLAIDCLAVGETELRDPTARRRLLGPTDQRTLGGFNWSSQRSLIEGCDGQAGWLDEGVDGL
jgi:hypothetical protein